MHQARLCGAEKILEGYFIVCPTAFVKSYGRAHVPAQF